MLFLKFRNDEERRNYGGSYFMEIQYCRLPIGTSDAKLTDGDIPCWDYTSLYVHEISEFFEQYADILDKGLYNNLTEGDLDVYGINYYNPEKTGIITEKIRQRKPADYEIFLEWLESDMNRNGFYVLGV